MWVFNLHSLFLYSDLPLPCHPPSHWLRLFSSQTFSCKNTPTFLKRSHSSYLPASEDGRDCSETSAYKIQTTGNYPDESVQRSEHGKSLKSRIKLTSYHEPHVRNGKHVPQTQNTVTDRVYSIFEVHVRLSRVNHDDLLDVV